MAAVKQQTLDTLRYGDALRSTPTFAVPKPSSTSLVVAELGTSNAAAVIRTSELKTKGNGMRMLARYCVLSLC